MENTDFVIHPDLFEAGFTQSELQTLDNCPEKWYFRYNLLLRRKGGIAWPLEYGSLLHDWQERWYATKGKDNKAFATIAKSRLVTAEDHASFEYHASLLKIQTEIYASHFKHDFEMYKVVEVETVGETNYRGIRLLGKLDLGLEERTSKETWITDHKGTYKIDQGITVGWSFRFQFMFYIWLAIQDPDWDTSRLKGIMVNAIRKPNLKQGKKEATNYFLERIRQDMLARPDFYFYRERFRIKKGDIERFQKEILDPKIDRLILLKMTESMKIALPGRSPLLPSLFRNKNTDHCMVYNRPCEFLAMCQRGMKLERFQYETRRVKHEELAE